MFAGKTIACVAGAALVACLGTAGVAGASGVRGAGWCADGRAGTACVAVDADRDGVCDNCGVPCERGAGCDASSRDASACAWCGRAGCDGTCDGSRLGTRGGTCDGSRDRARLRAHDGTCDGARAHGRCHDGR